MSSYSRGANGGRRILGMAVEEEVRSELEFHLQMRVRDLERRGISSLAAREQAEREFGDYESIQSQCRTIASRRNRTMRRREWLGELRQDVRFGVRQLLNNRGFGVVALLTLALGIGASTAIFSVVNGVLLRALPFAEPDRLVVVYQLGESGQRGNFSHPNFQDLKERSHSFAALAEHAFGPTPVVIGDEPVRVPVARVSSDFFTVLGVEPVLGRTFRPEEFGTDDPVVVVSDAFWKQHLGASRNLEQRPVRIGGQRLTVVGVLPRGVAFPGEAGIWRPQGDMASESRTGHNWQVVGRLRGGVSPATASAELDAIARGIKGEHGDGTMIAGAVARPLHEVVVGDARPALLVLLGASGLLLLIACANVVNLLLTRMAARQRELAVRLALGAGRARLVRQWVSESLILALLGGAMGTMLAVVGVRVLLALEPGRLPRVGEIRVDGVVLLFALAVSVLTAAAMGLLVSLRTSGSDIRATLAEGGRGQAGGVATTHLRSVLAAAQVAVTLVLLVGAGLLARSFLRLVEVDPGFRTSGAVVMEILIPWATDEQEASRSMRFHHELLERLAAIPDVREAGSANILPLGGGGGSSGTFLEIDGTEWIQGFADIDRLSREAGRTGEAEYRLASAGYFRAMGIPLLRGRFFDGSDTSDRTHAAVISRSLAETRWPGQDPVGRLVQYGGMDGDLRPFVIVGVVGDVRERGLDAEPRPTFYANVGQRPMGVFGRHEIVLYGGDPLAVTTTARRILREMNPEIPVRFRTLEEVFSAFLADRRFSLMLLGIFAGTALLLAVSGIYGLVSYVVAQRTREIGIRLALGAPAGTVLGMVVRGGVLLTIAGVVAGLLIALASTRLLSGLLFGISTTDPLTFIAVPLLLIGVAAIASFVPARRSTRVDPIIAMRM
jgi:putative ABC transport system permease protein